MQFADKKKIYFQLLNLYTPGSILWKSQTKMEKKKTKSFS